MEAGQNCLKSGAVLAIISGLQRVKVFPSPGLMPVTARWNLPASVLQTVAGPV